MYIYIHIYIYARMCIYIYAYVYIYIYIYSHIYTYIYMYACVCVCVCVHTQEATMTKMSSTVGEFAFMKEDLTRRLTSLENPKVDRIGGLESQSRAMAKQVCARVCVREGETERGRE